MFFPARLKVGSKTFGVYVAMLAVLCATLFAGACKPRRSDLSSEDEGSCSLSLDISKKIFCIAMLDSYASMGGVMINSDEVIDKIYEFLKEDTIRTDQEYDKHLKSATAMINRYLTRDGAIDKVILTNPSLKSDKGDDEVSLTEVIQRTYLKTMPLYVDQVCEGSNGNTVPRNFKLCYSHESCNAFLNSMQAYAVNAGQFSQGLDTNAHGSFRGLLKDAREDVMCLPSINKKDAMVYRADSMIATAEIMELMANYAVPNKRPIVAGNGTDMVIEQRLTKVVTELENLSSYATKEFLHPKDPMRVNKVFASSLFADEMIWGNFYRNESTGQSKLYSNVNEAINEDDVDNLTIADDGTIKYNLTESSRQAVDTFASSVVATHINNAFLLRYAARLKMNDITPWLDAIKRDAMAWSNWRRATLNDNKFVSNGVPNLSPNLAWNILAMNAKQEATLPFRRAYLDTMRFLAARFVVDPVLPSQQDAKNASAENDSLLREMDKFDKELDVRANRSKGDQGVLALRDSETLLARLYPNEFNSFNDMLDTFEAATSDLLKAQHQHSQLLEKFVEMTSEDQAKNHQRLTSLADDVKAFTDNTIREGLVVACMDMVAGGGKTIEYQSNQTPQQGMCFANVLYRFYNPFWESFDGQVSTASPMKGVINLPQVCGVTMQAIASAREGKAAPSINSMRMSINNAQAQQEINDHCKTISSTLVKDAAIHVASSLVLPPVMMHLGNFASAVLMNRLIAPLLSRGVALVSNEAGQVLLTRAITLNQASTWLLERGLGKFATLRVPLLGTKICLTTTLRDTAKAFGGSFLASVGMEVVNRGMMYAQYGEYYDRHKGFYQDVVKSVVQSTLVFFFMGGVTKLTEGTIGAWYTVRSPLKEAVLARRHWYWDYTATTLYFAADHGIRTMFDSFLQFVPEEDNRSFAEKLAHSAFMTIGFKGFHAAMNVAKGAAATAESIKFAQDVAAERKWRLSIAPESIETNIRGAFKDKGPYSYDFYLDTDSGVPAHTILGLRPEILIRENNPVVYKAEVERALAETKERFARAKRRRGEADLAFTLKADRIVQEAETVAEYFKDNNFRTDYIIKNFFDGQ